MTKITRHAASRYIERFAGNITLEQATARLEKIFRQARRIRPAPGNAYIYGTHGIYFVVEKRTIITVYRREETPAPVGTLKA